MTMSVIDCSTSIHVDLERGVKAAAFRNVFAGPFDKLPEPRRVVDQLPRGLTGGIAPQPKRRNLGLGIKAWCGPLGCGGPGSRAQRRERTVQDFVFLEAEGIDLPEVLGFGRLDLVRQECFGLIGGSLVKNRVT